MKQFEYFKTFDICRALDDVECETSGECISVGLDIKDPARLVNGVKQIHAAGGYVKIAVGGEVFGNPGDAIHFQDVDKLVNRLVRLVYDYNLDGVDLTTVRDCGYQELVLKCISPFV